MLLITVTDVSLANGELHQACGHVILSMWPKDGHRLSVSCTPLRLCSCSWVLSKSRSTPWPAWFSDVLLFPKFWHLTNLWHDFLSLHDLLSWPTCSFLLPCSFGLTVWPCERSVANRFYFFHVLLLSLPIISASLSNICAVAFVAWYQKMKEPNCMNRDGGAYSLPTAYDSLLVTCSTSRDHKPDKARRWHAKRRN